MKKTKLTNMQTELLGAVSDINLPIEDRVSKVEQVLDHGVVLDEHLLVIPDVNNLRATVAKDLVDAKRYMDEARKEDKHVLYIPGSYDLVHAGHASYALQVTDQYLAQHPGLTRDDVYVVMLSDDDELIGTVKAYKRKGYSDKGKEEFARPIESAEVFADMNLPHHSRLIGTASLPVDLVGFIPSPNNAKDFINHLVKAQDLDANILFTALEQFATERKISDTDMQELTAAISSYEKLIHHLGNGGFQEVADSFDALGKPYAVVDPNAPWSIQAYQLLNHKFLASGDGFKAPLVRIVSEHDDKYKDQVDFLMRMAGVNVEPINDIELVSTTKLLEKLGPDKLREAKRKHYIQ